MFALKRERIGGKMVDFIKILLQFQGISKKYITDKSKEAKQDIHEHLLRCSDLEDVPYRESKGKFDLICNYASKVLNPSHKNIPVRVRESEIETRVADEYGPKQRENPVFQKKWLCNIGRLLPDTEAVMRILPYLLTSYTYNICGRNLDPFDGSDSNASLGWQIIFCDNELTQEAKSNFSSNRSLSISRLVDTFTLAYRGRDGSYLFDGRSEAYEIYGNGFRQVDKVVLPKEEVDYDSVIECVKKRMIDRELYRRFLAFCFACKNYQEVNLSLSLALFANSWRYDNIYKYGGEPSEPVTNTFIHQFTEDEIEHDVLRNSIIEYAGKREPTGSDYSTIYELAHYAKEDYLDAISRKKRKESFEPF